MGTHFLFLTILPRRIDPRAWAQAYDDVHALWRSLSDGPDGGERAALDEPEDESAAPDVPDLPEVPELPAWARWTARPAQAAAEGAPRGGLLSLHRQPGRGGPRWVYRREVEHHGGAGAAAEEGASPLRHVQICGDARSRLVGEAFRVYQDLAVYRRRLLCPGDGPADILLPEPSQSAEVAVFSGVTGGAPYGRAVLAAAMLIEARFPGAALCFGEIDRARAQEAAALARRSLGRDLRLPVCVDPDALWARLSPALAGEDLWRAVLAWFRGEPGVAHEALLRLSGRDAGLRWLRAELRACRSLQQYGAAQRLVEWLNATGDLETLLRVACLDPDGPRFPAELMVSAVVDTCVTCAPAVRVGLRALQPLRAGAGVGGLAQLLDLQLAEALVDLHLTGRRVRAFIPLDQAEDAVRRCFGDPRGAGLSAPDSTADGLVRRLRAETARRVQCLADLCGPVLRSVEALRARLSDLDPAHLMRERRVVDLPPRAQRALLSYGLSILGLLVRLQRDQEFAVLVSGPAALLRARAVALLERRGDRLTAEAWADLDGPLRSPPVGAANDNAAASAAAGLGEAGPRAPLAPEDEHSLRFLVALVVAEDATAAGGAPRGAPPAEADGEDQVGAPLAEPTPRVAYRRALLENGALRRDLALLLRDPGVSGTIVGTAEDAGLPREWSDPVPKGPRPIPENDQHTRPFAIAN